MKLGQLLTSIKNLEKYLLILVMLLFFILRTHNIKTDLLFHYDQGLHSVGVWNIWHDKNLSLLGHPTDTDGLIHAPVYYWLMLPSYALSKGDPVFASIFQILLETLTIPLFFLAIKNIFNKNTAIISILLYSTSYGMICFSRWLVNVTPILPLTNIYLYLISRKQKRYSYLLMFLSFLTIGIITQMNAAVGLFMIPFNIWLFRKSKITKSLLAIISGILLPAFPLLIFQFRHDFVLIKAASKFIFYSEKGAGFSISTLISNTTTLLKQINGIILYPHFAITTILFILALISLKPQKKSALVYLFLFLPFFSMLIIKREAIGFFYTSVYTIIIAICAYALTKLPKILMIIAVTVIVGVNISNYHLIYKPTNALIPIGNDNLITIQDRKNIIDWIYKKSLGEQFSLWIYTIPFYLEEPWTYTLNWYANPKYNYLPEKTSGFFPNELKYSKYFFNIFEPERNKPEIQKQWFENIENNFGSILDSYSSHDLKVELRSWKGND